MTYKLQGDTVAAEKESVMRISPSMTIVAAMLFAVGMFFTGQFLFILMTAVFLAVGLQLVVNLPRSKEHVRPMASGFLVICAFMWAGHFTATYFSLYPADFISRVISGFLS